MMHGRTRVRVREGSTVRWISAIVAFALLLALFSVVQSITRPAGESDLSRRDAAETARNIVEQAVGEKLSGEPLDESQPDERDPEAVKRGQKGETSRNESLTPEQRSAIAKQAAEARWRRKGD